MALDKNVDVKFIMLTFYLSKVNISSYVIKINLQLKREKET